MSLDDIFTVMVVVNFSSSTLIFLFLQQVGFSPWFGFLPSIHRNLCSALNLCKLLLTRADQSCCRVEAPCSKSGRKVELLKLVVEQETTRSYGLETLKWTCQNTIF